VPELCFESRSTAVEQVSPTRRALARQPQRVQPERLDFDGFTDSRRHDVVADFGVHPRQLHPGYTRRQQAIVVGTDAESRAVRVAVENAVDAILQRLSIREREVDPATRSSVEEVVD